MSRKSLHLVFSPILILMFFAQSIYAAPVLQWAIDANGSSQYDTSSYSFKQLIGKPSVYPRSGNSSAAWCPKGENAGLEWIELTYEEAFIVQEIVVYETYNPGAITKVELRDESGALHLVWTGTPAPTGTGNQALKIPLPHNQVVSRKVRITLDTSKVPGWNEIDTVTVSGKFVPGTQFGTNVSDHFGQWATSARGSSQYNTADYSFKQLVGEPDVYPQYGDNKKAWAPREENAGLEWIELTYREAVFVDAVRVYETYYPGAIIKAELITTEDSRYVIWEGSASAVTGKARIFSIRNNSVRLPVNKVVLTLDTSKVRGWNEIDAVQVTGWRNSSSQGTFTKRELSLEDQLQRLLDKARANNLAQKQFLDELEALLKAYYLIK